MNVDEIVEVTLYFVTGEPTRHLIKRSDVEIFVDATLRLHWKPGINPHNKIPTAKIWKLDCTP